jgi:hypothetical protein
MKDLTPFMRARNLVLGAVAAAVGAGAALGAGACGGGDEIPSTITTNLPGGPRTAPATSTPAATTQASTAQPPASGSTTATGATTNTNTTATTQSTRVPAVFTLKTGALTPKTVSVPAFLAAEVTVTSADARAHVITVKVGKGYTLQVPPKGSATVKVPGQKTGRFQVLVDNRPAAAIAWGGEPGP